MEILSNVKSFFYRKSWSVKKLNDSSAIIMFDHGELVRVSLKKFEKEEYSVKSVENFKNMKFKDT